MHSPQEEYVIPPVRALESTPLPHDCTASPVRSYFVLRSSTSVATYTCYPFRSINSPAPPHLRVCFVPTVAA